MRTTRLLPLVLILAACTKDEPTDDTQNDTQEDTQIEDTSPVLVDEDQDGHYDDVDCDDTDPAIFPGAQEDCDEIDNDCDELTDEGFDVDEDGHLDDALCAHGDDCDDTDDSIHTGATEVPYDGIDQDCDTADLTDVDGDGFDGMDAGGNDCDDDDDSIYPGAEDIPKDGIDQDCVDGDDLDADDDGFDDEAHGGTDCDDDDPDVNPDASDYLIDGVDADCDTRDGGRADLDQLDIYVEGDSSRQGLLGNGLAVCDIDEDGMDDLIMSAPFENSYGGYVSVFYGANYSTWSAGMAPTDGDTVIADSTNTFLGFNLICADIDGDGHMDLVTQRGEINYGSTYQTDFGLVIFYGDGTAFSSTMSSTDAGTEMTFDMGAPSLVASVMSATMSSGDLDGDGASEIFLMMGSTSADAFDGDDRAAIVPGATYSGSLDLDSYWSHLFEPRQGSELSWAGVLPDLDGDGNLDLAIGSSAYLDTAWDTANWDTAQPSYGYTGRLDWMGVAPSTSTSLSLDDETMASVLGGKNQELGVNWVSGDFDGDGVDDLLVAGAGADDGEGSETGSLFLFNDFATDLASIWWRADSTADAYAYGERDDAYLGLTLVNVGDVDGDGADDVLIGSPDRTSGFIGKGEIYLVSGADLTGGLVDIDALAMMHWRGAGTEDLTGATLASGDFDGDGNVDVAIGEPYYGTNAQGRVYVHLGADW